MDDVVGAYQDRDELRPYAARDRQLFANQIGRRVSIDPKIDECDVDCGFVLEPSGQQARKVLRIVLQPGANRVRVAEGEVSDRFHKAMLEPTPGSIAPSYAALLRVPGFGRVALGTLLGRLAGQMWEIVLVLFVLQRYQSAALAGLTVLLSILPGLILSPLAGALLDRQGRVGVVGLEYAVTAGIGAMIAAVSLGHRLPPPLLLLIVSVLGVSNILIITGGRSPFPPLPPPAPRD